MTARWLDPSPLLGTPYRPQGADYAGADCWGLVYLAHRDYRDPPTAPEPFEASALGWVDVPAGAERLGDVALMGHNYPEDPPTTHVGLVVGGGYLYHAVPRVGTVAANYRRPEVRNQIRGFVRCP